MGQYKEILQKLLEVFFISKLVSKEQKSAVQPGAENQVQKFPNIHGNFLASSKSSNF